jgi:hypothetical protein
MIVMVGMSAFPSAWRSSPVEFRRPFARAVRT